MLGKAGSGPERARDCLRWWRSRSELTRDIIGTAVFTAVAFSPVLAASGTALAELPPRDGGAAAVLLALAQSLPLAVRRRWPAWCLGVTGLAFAAYQCLAYPTTFTGEGLILALYAAGAYHERHRISLAAAATAAYAALAVALARLGAPERPVDYLTFYCAVACAWGAGTAIRLWRLREAEHRQRAADQAVTAERARIARELHDVVTHHVTAMVVQADAAQFLLAGEDGPHRVSGELGDISGSGRRALTELRYLLGLLEAARAEPSVKAGRLRDLAEQTRQAGQPVEFAEEGVPAPMTDSAELAVYRVVQEALTNALKHAPGQPTLVRVRHDGDGTGVEVTTDGPVITGDGFTPGRGLAGLRERVAGCGGDLEAGARPGGGFRVRARVPGAGRPARPPGELPPIARWRAMPRTGPEP